MIAGTIVRCKLTHILGTVVEPINPPNICVRWDMSGLETWERAEDLELVEENLYQSDWVPFDPLLAQNSDFLDSLTYALSGQECGHVFKGYIGLSERFDYCTKCDYKKPHGKTS